MAAGIARIDLGATKVKAKGTYKPLEDDSVVSALAKGFKYKTSQAGNPMIEVTYEIDDEDALDIDGGTDYGKLWDLIVFTEKSAKSAKLKLIGLQYDGVDELILETKEDYRNLVADLKENYLDQPVVLVTENEEYNDKLRTKVKWVNVPE